MRDWDDLRYFLAVARSGSLAGAARSLGVNHSTVFRRIDAFEERLGVRLFERHREGYALTVAGDEMFEAAERVSSEIDAMERRIGGRDLRLSGPLAVTTTDDLMTYLLGPPLAGFQSAYPGIELSVILDNQFFNLSKRQADVAIRPTSSPPDALVGRRIGKLAFAVYGAKDTAPRDTSRKALAAQPWIAFDDSLAHLAAAKWQKDTFDGASIALRSNNLMTMVTGVENGMGLALLPCFAGDILPGLTRVSGVIKEAGTDLWLLTHEDLRNTQRVRAFMDHMGERLSELRDRLEGRG